MSAVAKRRSRRGYTKKRRQSPLSCSLVIAATLMIVMLGAAWILSHAHILDVSVRLDTRYEVSGPPTISANFINRVLDFYGSPASGKGQALYDDGVKYTIDPVYALAFFMHESSFGTTGVARVTLSLGNIRATPGYKSYDGYRKYASWEDGFVDWYKLIKKQYVQEWKLKTIDQIIPVYAPSADHNDVDAYIQGIKNAVDSWRLGEVRV